VTKAMKRRDVEQALKHNDCSIKSTRGDHDKWICHCGRHSANIPRHTVISPGVVRDIIRRLECLQEGWLQ
jgi:hypothetical protein